jgi:hypothetical protein
MGKETELIVRVLTVLQEEQERRKQGGGLPAYVNGIDDLITELARLMAEPEGGVFGGAAKVIAYSVTPTFVFDGRRLRLHECKQPVAVATCLTHADLLIHLNALKNQYQPDIVTWSEVPVLGA